MAAFSRQAVDGLSVNLTLRKLAHLDFGNSFSATFFVFTGTIRLKPCAAPAHGFLFSGARHLRS